MESGIDMAVDRIPVGPVQHYIMGGIKTDLWGKTNITGLYACGEAACTGVHGANRLASNSTLECLVFGRRCATSVNNRLNDSPVPLPAIAPYDVKEVNIDVVQEKNAIKGIMVKFCGIIRNQKGLSTGLERISEVLSRIKSVNLSSPQMMELYNMALVSKCIITAAIARKDSVGAHYRED